MAIEVAHPERRVVMPGTAWRAAAARPVVRLRELLLLLQARRCRRDVRQRPAGAKGVAEARRRRRGRCRACAAAEGSDASACSGRRGETRVTKCVKCVEIISPVRPKIARTFFKTYKTRAMPQTKGLP